MCPRPGVDRSGSVPAKPGRFAVASGKEPRKKIRSVIQMIASRRPTELAGRSAIGGAGGIRGDHIALYDMGAPIVLFPKLPQVRANGGIAGNRGRGIASPDLAGYLAE